MTLDKEELRKLPIRERIERLMKLEKERKKEIEEAQKLMDESRDELDKEKILENVEVPEIEPVDISKLFVSEEGIEANVEVEQERYEDFNIQYVNILERTAYESEGIQDLYGLQNLEIPLKKIDEAINPDNYFSESKKQADRSTASRGVAEDIKKYSAG